MEVNKSIFLIYNTESVHGNGDSTITKQEVCVANRLWQDAYNVKYILVGV